MNVGADVADGKAVEAEAARRDVLCTSRASHLPNPIASITRDARPCSTAQVRRHPRRRHLRDTVEQVCVDVVDRDG